MIGFIEMALSHHPSLCIIFWVHINPLLVVWLMTNIIVDQFDSIVSGYGSSSTPSFRTLIHNSTCIWWRITAPKVSKTSNISCWAWNLWRYWGISTTWLRMKINLALNCGDCEREAHVREKHHCQHSSRTVVLTKDIRYFKHSNSILKLICPWYIPRWSIWSYA